MYEVPNNTGRFCIECNNEMGYLDPKHKKFYESGSIKVQSVFVDRIHPKFNKLRQRCFDCAIKKVWVK